MFEECESVDHLSFCIVQLHWHYGITGVAYVRRVRISGSSFILRCLRALALWNRLFGLAGFDSIIVNGVFGGLPRGKSLWYIVSLTLIWLWQERNMRIFLGQMYFGGNVGFILFLLFSSGIN